MLRLRFLSLALVTLFLTTLIHYQEAEAGSGMQMKKMFAALMIAKMLKPRFVPLPIPIPFKFKINKGEKIVPYSMDGGYGGMGGGGYGGMGGGGGYGMGGGGGFGMGMGGGGGYGGGGGGY